MTKRPRAHHALVATCLLGGLALVAVPSGAEPPKGSGNGQPARTPQAHDKTAADPEVVAYVNGQPITRRELGEELIARKGKEQLELLINRRIIEQACQKAGITVTDAEVEADLKEVLRSFNMNSPKEFERVVLRARNTNLYEYREDVIRPAIAMRKLAGTRIQITEDDVRQAFAARYGEKIRCRVIVLPDRDLRVAERIYNEVRDSEEAFIRQARMQTNPTLAAVAGETLVHRQYPLPNVEKEAFALKDGETSHILQTPEGLVILRRIERLPPDTSRKLEDVRDELVREVQERKLRQEIPKLFRELRQQADVQDFLNNKFDIKHLLRSAP